MLVTARWNRYGYFLDLVISGFHGVRVFNITDYGKTNRNGGGFGAAIGSARPDCKGKKVSPLFRVFLRTRDCYSLWFCFFSSPLTSDVF